MKACCSKVSWHHHHLLVSTGSTHPGSLVLRAELLRGGEEPSGVETKGGLRSLEYCSEVVSICNTELVPTEECHEIISLASPGLSPVPLASCQPGFLLFMHDPRSWCKIARTVLQEPGPCCLDFTAPKTELNGETFLFTKYLASSVLL